MKWARFLFCLLALLFSLSSPAMGGNARFWQSHLAAESVSGRGYQCFSAFKQTEGIAGEGQAWHHIVEQTPGNVERFGAETIHNTENLAQLPHGPGTIHNQISGFYSSKQPFTGGQTLRQWLSSQSFEEQATFGRNVIQQFGGKP